MQSRPVYQIILLVALLANPPLATTSAHARDTKTEEPVFEFSSSVVAPTAGATTVFYIWKINRIDGSLYLCQTSSGAVRCDQVAGASSEVGPFSLSDVVNLESVSKVSGLHVWRVNRWTGTQELCVSSVAQAGCFK